MIRKLLRGPVARSKTIVAARLHWGMRKAVLGGYANAAKRSWSQYGEDDVLVDGLVEDRRLGDAAFRVLTCLGTYADKDGWCWPSTLMATPE